MKVLMICTEKLPVPPILGGAIQTYISGCLPYLSKSHEITILGRSDPSLPDQEFLNGVEYIRVPGKVFEIYRAGVVKYLESASFDLIHVFNRPRLVLPVRNAAPHSKITLSMHNDMFNLDKIAPTEASSALKEISQIVTVSDYVGNIIRQLYPQASSKIRTIYSGVDTERFLPGNHSKMQKIRNDLRREHGLENKTVILFAGRLSNNKGVDRLIRALPKLAEKYNDLALVIVGSNWFSQNNITDYVGYVRALAKKLPVPVVTTGFVSPYEIQNWFAASDLFVCTSLWPEPLARVHYEAMAAGLPIITTARGGNPEVIRINENGLVVEEPENPDNFAEKISNLLSNKSLMKKMGERGRELSVSQYQWDRVASELLEVWRDAEQITHEASPQQAADETTEVLIEEKVAKELIKESSEKTNGNSAETSFQEQKIEESAGDSVKEQKIEESAGDSVKEQKIEESAGDSVKEQKIEESAGDSVKEQKIEESAGDSVKEQKIEESAGDSVKEQKIEESAGDSVKEQKIEESAGDSVKEQKIEESAGDSVKEQKIEESAGDSVKEQKIEESAGDSVKEQKIEESLVTPSKNKKSKNRLVTPSKNKKSKNRLVTPSKNKKSKIRLGMLSKNEKSVNHLKMLKIQQRILYQMIPKYSKAN